MSGWLFTPEMPWISIAVWALLGLTLMYLARSPAQRALLRGSRLLHTQLRLGARGLQRLADGVARREHGSLRDLQLEMVRRQLEREIQRLSHIVERDLAGFQRLQRQLDEQIVTVTEDYEHAGQVPPPPPEWVAAVDAIARLPRDANAESVSRILNDIHATVQHQQREAMREYRWSVTARHKILADMRPSWGQLRQLLERVTAKVNGLERRISHIDRLMERFEALLAGGRVTLSAITARFLLSAVGLGLAVGLGIFNFELLASPLAATLGHASLGPVAMSDYAAAIQTLAVVGIGMLLFESLQVTRMFPLVYGLSARARSILVLLSLGLLATMATLGSVLAVWWQTENPGLPAQVMALLGLSVPLLLALSVLPLEMFGYTLLPVLSASGRLLLSLTIMLMRVGGSLALQLGQLLVQLYDIVLAIPLSLERAWWQHRAATAATSPGARLSAPDIASPPRPAPIGHTPDTPVPAVATTVPAALKENDQRLRPVAAPHRSPKAAPREKAPLDPQ